MNIDSCAMSYEMLIRRSFNSDRGKKGGDADIFRALMREEWNANENPTNKKYQSAYEKRKQGITVYLTNAIEKAITRLRKKKVNVEIIQTLIDLIDRLQLVNNSSDYEMIINEAMEIFIEHDISWITKK